MEVKELLKYIYIYTEFTKLSPIKRFCRVYQALGNQF